MGMGYRDLAAQLRGEIERATTPRATLPKQADLAEQFGVNVKTVRNAVALLEAEGLVTPVRRRGTVVRQRPPMRRLGAARYSRASGSTATALLSSRIGRLPVSPTSERIRRRPFNLSLHRRPPWRCWVSSPTARSTRVDVSSGWKEGRLTRSATTGRRTSSASSS